MRYELVIFDWDGTLADSTGRIVDSMQKAGRLVGLPTIPDSAVQNIIGLGLPEALKALWPMISPEQMASMHEAYARNFVHDSQVHMSLFDGVEALLQRLQAAGVLLAVATGKSRKGLNRLLEDLALGHYFAATRCADETRSKPDPLMLDELLGQLSVPVEKALMVGDTTWDLDMAAAIGMDSAGMAHGAHDDDALLGSGPRVLCNSIAELEQWFFAQ